MSAGYSILASLMGAYPEVAIFRRFGAINARNLLYLQAELTALEKELLDAEKADLESGHPDRSIYSRDWRTLAESIEAPDGDGSQWQIFLRLREKLREYNAAMLEQMQLSRLSPPNLRDLRFLVDWMKAPSMGNVYLLGPDSDIWEKPDHLDMIAINPRESDNSLSRLITKVLIYWYHRLVGWKIRKPKEEEYAANTVYYSQAGLERISRLLITVIASILPVVSIVVLYSIDSMLKRLGVIGLFTALFSFALGLLTRPGSGQ